MNRELSSFISILLQRIPIERLLCSSYKQNTKRIKIYYDELDVNLVKDLMLSYRPSIGDAVIECMIDEIRTQINSNPLEMKAPDNIDKINIFSMISYYVKDILTFYDNQIVCKYDRILEWNELTRIIGKDLPISAFLAYEDWKNGETRKNFFWPPVIGHDNGNLNRMLAKGMAENHFHLRGSTPYFDISWINLMNHPSKHEYMEALDFIEENQRDKHRKALLSTTRQGFKTMIREAALIRLYLGERLSGLSLSDLEDANFLNLNSQGIIKERNLKQDNAGKTESQSSVISKIDNFKKGIRSSIQDLLNNSELLELKTLELQKEIDVSGWRKRRTDYLLDHIKQPVYSRDVEYWILSGERWFIYHMFKCVLSQDKNFSRDEYNMFLAYIRIKNELRGELIQNNDILGFDNFQLYQDRKDVFSHTGDWIASEGTLARLAVRDVLSNPSVKQLEIRITPAKTAQLIMEDIRGYDHAILSYDGKDAVVEQQVQRINAQRQFLDEQLTVDQRLLRERYHYVFHFTKQRDTSRKKSGIMECRHYQYREMLLQRTAEIILFRQRYPEYADRLVGIDACSREIGCRPEVFGRAFRTLRFYRPPEPSTAYLRDHPANQLRFTYHVGEDYLDIIDGLRAIDEAIRFLAMGPGDRLGHAMALGINAVRWYARRGNKIILPIQDFIDNIVWMHHNLIHFGIENMSSLRGWLEEKYSQYFDYAYQPYIRNWCVQRKQSDNGDEYYADLAQNGFDINTYYLSWLLRGDKPELYKSGAFSANTVVDQWKELAINAKYIKRQDIRHIPQVTLLYSMYHYNVHVRERGSEVKTFRLHHQFSTAVSLIQKKMQEKIDDMGIAIETNPSSNYKISLLDSYSEHPIKELYNIGLVSDAEELNSCTQMNVSINTDDNGVFSTRLENEYALMACALEEARDSYGKPLYKRQNIYRWLDNIREMGLRQSFYNFNNEENEHGQYAGKDYFI